MVSNKKKMIMWRYRRKDKLNSIRMQQTQLEENIKSKKKENLNCFQIENDTINNLISKVSFLEKEVSLLKNTKIILSPDDKIEERNKKLSEEIPLFIPTPNIDGDKKISDSCIIKTRTKKSDVDLTLQQLENVTKYENY